MVLRAPVAMPEDPKPAIARPTMNMTDDWAAPQSADPTSKMRKKTRKHHWTVGCQSPQVHSLMQKKRGGGVPWGLNIKLLP